MSKTSSKDEKKTKKPISLPKKYEKPEVHSEDLLAFAAACNGAASGGRKSNTGAPDFCRSDRMNS